MTFKKILVANRGEIAVRVIRALKEMGVKSVGVYSEADQASRHLALADETVRIGPAMSAKSYLNIDNIISAAIKTGVDAVHPGYGYLAENEEFAKTCEQKNLVFIGPTPENLKLAGDKITAKTVMKQAGVPVIPSSPAEVASIDDAVSISEKLGYPVMVKSSGGGGGRGIRICKDRDALIEDFPVAKMEARAVCGNDKVYIEKYIEKPRHIEFQILADHYGNITHLGERECTIQRRYQKLIEESPSPILTDSLRQEMGEVAILAAKAANYFNAGTVEFLLDKENRCYFMEINARIQVEHPVTEMVSGIDLIKSQICLSSMDKLTYSFDDLDMRGCAIECRINAEDPDKKFMPSPGKIVTYVPPGGYGVRIDTHIYQGYELPIYYDSLIAKLITHDMTRLGAISIMKRSLEEMTIGPIKTTIPLYLKIFNDPMFLKGDFDTGYINRFIEENDEGDD
ncbi:MAG: acetyl-CoA carboxylase biotin carboxylase subunit [Deltaproteobacteria bacterium]|nr:acetyl-CoA carboxylase biotin carboxylase subunit [Deltaproteobacteria bacterium]